MDRFSVEASGIATFQVRITRPDGSMTVVPAFLSWREAQDWINEQLRLQREALVKDIDGS